MESKKTLVLLLVAAAVLGAVFFFVYSPDGEAGQTSLLSASEQKGEIVTPEKFEEESQEYTLELTTSGEVVAR